MKYIMKVRFPSGKEGNDLIRDPKFGKKIQDLIAEVKAEAVYFTLICGTRGAYIIVNMDDPSQMPALAEPFFLWAKADVDFLPVMTVQDLEKATPAIEAAIKKWG